MWPQTCHFLKNVKAILSYSHYFYLNFTQLRLIFLKSLYQELSKEVWHMCIKLGELKKLLSNVQKLEFSKSCIFVNMAFLGALQTKIGLFLDGDKIID